MYTSSMYNYTCALNYIPNQWFLQTLENSTEREQASICYSDSLSGTIEKAIIKSGCN